MNLKTIRIATCILFLLALPMYLGTGQNDDTESPVLVWRDADTRDILFSSDDITTFDWDKQVFHLKLDATLDFLGWISTHRGQFKKLVVEDESGPVYDAWWVSGFSSMGFKGPVYKPLSPNPFIAIENGYPGGRKIEAEEEDPRFAPRLKAGLEKAGKLHSIDLNWGHTGLKIETMGHWRKDVGEDMSVKVEYFGDTFRLGRKARAHILFAGGEKTLKWIDSIALEIKLVANDGSFRSDTRIDNISVEDIEDGIYVCKFDPWQPAEGSDTEAETGTGLLSLTMLFRKAGRNIYRLEFPESLVSIKGRIKPE